jgi:hypothetical protein
VTTGAAGVLGEVVGVVAPALGPPPGANPVPAAAPAVAGVEPAVAGAELEGVAVVGEVAPVEESALAGFVPAEESAVGAEEVLEAPEKLCAAATEKTPLSATPPATTQPVVRDTRRRPWSLASGEFTGKEPFPSAGLRSATASGSRPNCS